MALKSDIPVHRGQRIGELRDHDDLTAWPKGDYFPSQVYCAISEIEVDLLLLTLYYTFYKKLVFSLSRKLLKGIAVMTKET